MSTESLRVVRRLPDAKLPTKGHVSDHCFDFYAAETVVIRPGQTHVIDLGVNLDIPDGHALILKERSGLATKGIIVGAGVIDTDYRGPVKAVIRWLPPDGGFDEEMTASCGYGVLRRGYQDRIFVVAEGDKIVQGMLMKTIDLPVEEVTVSEFSTETVRGENGFGSTGG